eukprot:992469-Rhodomonas_salina.4
MEQAHEEKKAQRRVRYPDLQCEIKQKKRNLRTFCTRHAVSCIRFRGAGSIGLGVENASGRLNPREPRKGPDAWDPSRFCETRTSTRLE